MAAEYHWFPQYVISNIIHTRKKGISERFIFFKSIEIPRFPGIFKTIITYEMTKNKQKRQKGQKARLFLKTIIRCDKIKLI